MNSVLRRLRTRLVAGLLGADLRGEFDAIRHELDRAVELSAAASAEADETVRMLRRTIGLQVAIVQDELDGIEMLGRRLDEVRATADYRSAKADREPLVSVRIATYLRTEELMDVAIPSVIGQTWDRWEMIVVNDGPNERTRRAVTGMRDPRIRFEETPRRGAYPDDPRSRWLLAGVPGMNRGASLAQGAWIAPLDDDDSFSADHIEKLLNVAWAHDAELAYGALSQRNLVTGEERRIWSDPPEPGGFSFQGSIYLTALRFFEYDMRSWLLDEPADWNLIRRMKEAGVAMACTPEVIGNVEMVPWTHKDADGRRISRT